jgi:hypothetical protein
MEIIIQLINFITSPQLQAALLPLKIIFIAVSLAMLAFIIFFVLKTNWLRFAFLQNAVEFLSYRPYGLRKITKSWAKILARLETASEQEYKLAVIEADSMLEDILKRMGYPGSNLEEILGNLTSATLPNIDEIFQAHRLRNNIVHDPNFHLSLDQARKTLQVYEKAFDSLQAF